tara:strand:- start:13 stop:756 length:744 start_codon:yes stop_codon:yes gene_type:complete
MKIGIVTTFSDNGYKEYGHWFVESVHKFIDENINVFFYTDNVDIKLKSNITNQRLEKSIPDLTKFKNRNKDKSPSNFMFDAVRFSHKSYCLYHAAKTKDVDLLCWLDTDTEIISKITPNYIQNFLPKGKFVAYLGREGTYTETGFLVFDMRHNYASEYFERFKSYYDTNKIYELEAQLDCHVFDAVRIEMEKEGKISNQNISPPGITKTHFDQALNGYIAHYKGAKKTVRDKHYGKALKRKEKLKIV